MADIDHFKLVNDNYGHGVGDEVIILLAEILHANTRKDDLVGRYGGEEFCIVLPGLTTEQAISVAERIRISLKADSEKKYDDGPHCKASLGVASIHDKAADPSDLNNQADQALYVAKESGRNKVVRWTAEQVEQTEQQKIPVSSDSSPLDKGGDIIVDSVTETSSESTPMGAGVDEVIRLRVKIKELEDIASKYSKEINFRNNYDSLTGLPNHVLFYDRIKYAIAHAHRYDHTLAVLTLDIDFFRRINSELGRSGGDILLRKLAHRLGQTVRETDSVTIFENSSSAAEPIISRLSADEFGVLLTDLKDRQSVTWVVERIFEVLSKPIKINDQEIVITANIGVSVYPNDGDSADKLLNHSVAARKFAKNMSGQNNYLIFDPQLHEVSLTQIDVERELRQAIKNEEFVLYYQPKVGIANLTISGLEALIRWNHPTKGLLGPFEFIGVAEQSGLIVEIGEWVIKQACLQIKQWISLGMDNIRVAVNLSTLQLRQKDFSDRILTLVEGAGLSPDYLELEITETVIMDNLSTAVDTLNRLHNRGFWISIDDFGTGYSSLSYLKHLPLDTLKIDRSFVQDIITDNYDKTIVKTIIAMAHSMDLKVIAEGVETREQLALLRQYSCDEMQGYLFSRPVPAEEATQLLQTKTRSQLECVN